MWKSFEIISVKLLAYTVNCLAVRFLRDEIEKSTSLTHFWSVLRVDLYFCTSIYVSLGQYNELYCLHKLYCLLNYAKHCICNIRCVCVCVRVCVCVCVCAQTNLNVSVELCHFCQLKVLLLQNRSGFTWPRYRFQLTAL